MRKFYEEQKKKPVINHSEFDRLTEKYLAGKIGFDEVLDGLGIAKDDLYGTRGESAMLQLLRSSSKDSGLPLETLRVQRLEDSIRYHWGFDDEPEPPEPPKPEDVENVLKEAINAAIERDDLKDALKMQMQLMALMEQKLIHLEEKVRRADSWRQIC